MDSESGRSSSMAFPFPSAEDTHSFVKYVSETPLVQQLSQDNVLNPIDSEALLMPAHLLAVSLTVDLQRRYAKIRHEKVTLEGEKTALEGRLATAAKRIDELESERTEVERLKLGVVKARREALLWEERAESLRIEKEMYRREVQKFESRIYDIKSEGVCEYVAGPRFMKRCVHVATPIFHYAGQMGVNQMAKIAQMEPIVFKPEPGKRTPSAGPYRIPTLGKVEGDHTFTLEAWSVTDLYEPGGDGSALGKRKSDALEAQAPPRLSLAAVQPSPVFKGPYVIQRANHQVNKGMMSEAAKEKEVGGIPRSERDAPLEKVDEPRDAK